MMINRVAASALSYFCAKTSASYVSRSVDIQACLSETQRTNIRKVPLYHKFHHHLIVLQRRYIGDNQPNDFASRLQSTQIGFGTHHKVRGVTIYKNVKRI